MRTVGASSRPAMQTAYVSAMARAHVRNCASLIDSGSKERESPARISLVERIAVVTSKLPWTEGWRCPPRSVREWFDRLRRCAGLAAARANAQLYPAREC